MTGVGSKSYWKILWDRMIGEEELSYIDVEKMDSQDTEDLDEIQVFKEIRQELGILPVRFSYMPKAMFIKEYEIDYNQNRAVIMYGYNNRLIRYAMYMNDDDSSFAQTELDEMISEYEISEYPSVIIRVKEYDVEDVEENRYVAEFEYQDAQYQLMGIMEKEEFDKILKNLYFSQ